MGDFTWAVNKVISDWRERKPKQIRNTLPASFTASKLRYIRITACSQAAPDTIECRKWTQTDPYPPSSDSWSYSFEKKERKGPYLRTSDYVCAGCKDPCVTNETLIDKLGLSENNVDFASRTLQRYMNAEDQMPIDRFRRVIAGAYEHGWLGLWQAVSIANNVDELEATRRGLMALIRRAAERKAYLQRGDVGISREAIKVELEKQMRVRSNEMTRAIAARLKADDLPPDIRQFMEESVAPGPTER
jgi:hypothetical protein